MRKTKFDKKRLQEVTEQQARKLHRWGFDWPSNHQVGDVYFPTVEAALQWCRDEQGVQCGVGLDMLGECYVAQATFDGSCRIVDKGGFDNYMKAASYLLDQVLDVLEGDY